MEYLEKILDSVKKMELKESFVGSTSPSIFVGRMGYPNVFTGILSSPEEVIINDPETWYYLGLKIYDIVKLRLKLVYPREKINVKSFNRYVEIQQEAVQSQDPCELEVELKRRPNPKVEFYKYSAPVSNPAPVKKIRMVGNPKIPRPIEKVVDDYDLDAFSGVNILYKRGIKVSRIEQIFSSGLLGLKPQRKLVPTRWAVTGVDEMISRNMLKKIKDYDVIEKPILFSNTYLGNHYEILLIPSEWSYELIEVKYPGCIWNHGEKPKILSDFETHFGRNKYVEETAGGYYATRLGIVEYLTKIRKKAAAFVIRECFPEYTLPLGVWVVRETARHAFDNPAKRFESIKDALNEMKKRLRIDWKHIEMKSEFLKWIKEQKRLSEFLKFSE